MAQKLVQEHGEVLLIFLPQTQGESWVLGKTVSMMGPIEASWRSPQGAGRGPDSTLGYGFFVSWRSRTAFSLRLSPRNVLVIPRRTPASPAEAFSQRLILVLHM